MLLFFHKNRPLWKEYVNESFKRKNVGMYTYKGYTCKERKIRMTLIEIISYLSIAVGIIQTIVIVIDIIRYPQKMMPIMNIVWPLTGLYFPIIGIWAYFKLGRNKNHMKMNMDMGNMNIMEAGMDMALSSDHLPHHHEHMDHNHSHMHHQDKPFWQSVFVSTTHCSSGCSIGDLIGAPLVFVLGWTDDCWEYDVCQFCC